MNFINTLSWWQWAILAAIPPAIVALYFLKLRRRPLEVPSTFLWRRTIEDLHVNSLWQRLRRSLLLFLQLLLVAFVMLAVLRPGWQGEGSVGGRLILLIDNSASMGSTDVSPNRLEQAKEQAARLIAGIGAGDAAMIIAFSDDAVQVQQFTGNKQELLRQLQSIQPTNRGSDITEALRLAAGLAGAGGGADAEISEDAPAPANAPPARLFIFSDGGFPSAAGVDLGRLEPQYVIVGEPAARNVGITAFSVARNEERPDQVQAICRVENFGPDEVDTVLVSIYLNEEKDARDTAAVELTGGIGGYAFDVTDMESGTLRVELEHEDDFAGDNVAYAAVNAPRRANVLLLTPRNDALVTALSTGQARRATRLLVEPSGYMTDPATRTDYDHLAQTAAFDLIIYDQCAPQRMPNSNTLFIGTLPPGTEPAEMAKPPSDAEGESAEGEAAGGTADERSPRPSGVWRAGAKQPAPLVIDVDRLHPLMRYVELGNVRIAEAVPLVPPPGGTKLIDSDIGAIFAIAPRESFEDAVLGFELVGTDDAGGRYANTDWTIRRSFPLFFMNVVHYLGGQSASLLAESVPPGQPLAIRTDSPVDTLRIVGPTRGADAQLRRQGQAAFNYSKTDALGIYEVYEGKARQPAQRFAVNLFDPAESNIAPRRELEIGEWTLTGAAHWQPSRRETWKWILLAGLGLLAAEWWIWNRRVYL